MVKKKKKNLPVNGETQEIWIQSLSWEDPLEKGKAAHYSILAGEFHGLLSMGSQIVGHD